MNNLEIIISGNLTGFSRFYASSGANNLFKDTKIDLDCRNFVTFVEEKDKAYAISFAPQVITLSLITRILDSFHRPGILVVSLLLPRNKKVESVNNSQDEKAVYQLLNAINNKFYERNFKDGMLIQNPIVLMQDYYTDILVNYRLTQDYQRGVNLTIDNSAFNKNIGYVKSSEKDIASYLNTPCRRAYEGYHSIIISPKAPQNIDEPVEELKLYNVYVNNTKQRLSNVTIDSVIQTVFPERGEIDVPDNVKNITYRQALDGQGVPYVNANMNGDTIHLAYRFEKEERQVTFKIMKGSDEVDFSLVTLVIQNDDGTYYTISSNPYIFVGKEIYKAKTLKSGDDNYNFSQPLDLSRIPDGGTIPVKILPAVSHLSNTRAENSKQTPLVSPVGGHGKTLATNAYRNIKNESPIRNSGVLLSSKSNNDKGKSKSNHEIRKVVIPLVALWLVLGGIYAAWRYFSKNTETIIMNVDADDLIDKTISFYIADTSGSQGEVSDSLKNKVCDKLGNNNIILEMTTSINGNPVINTLKSGKSANDTILYAIEVKGNTTETLNVNLKVKWNGGQETVLLEEQRSFLLSDLVKEKYTIQLPVAFSDLIFYNSLKKSKYMEDGTFNRINIIKDKSEMLYDKMMEAYRHKDVRIKVKPLSAQTDANKDNKVLTKKHEIEALKVAKGMNEIDTNGYKWTGDNEQNAKNWNAKLKKIKKYNGEDKNEKMKQYRNKLQNCTSLKALLSVAF